MIPQRAHVDATTDVAPPQVRALAATSPRRYTAIDERAARVLGPHRGPTLLYGYLSTRWFEHADPASQRKRKEAGKSVTLPGDWISASYDDLCEAGGTRSRQSIRRWLSVLTDDLHPCIWASACASEHPLVVSKRVGHKQSNLYRRWECGTDVVPEAPRTRIRSTALQAAAKNRNWRGGKALEQGVPAPEHRDQSSVQLPFERSDEDPQRVFIDPDMMTHATPSMKTHSKSSGRPMTGLHEDPQRDAMKTHEGSCIIETRENTQIQQQIAGARDEAAAADAITDEEAVAIEVVDDILALAQRVESGYSLDSARAVARQLAAAALKAAGGDCAVARSVIRTAANDKRLRTAERPVAFLIRGILGKKGSGADAYLLSGTPSRGQSAALHVVPNVNAPIVRNVEDAPRPEDPPWFAAIRDTLAQERHGVLAAAIRRIGDRVIVPPSIAAMRTDGMALLRTQLPNERIEVRAATIDDFEAGVAVPGGAAP